MFNGQAQQPRPVHGGNETTLLALYNALHHWRAIVVAPGYNDPSIAQEETMSHHSRRRHVVVVGRSPEKMRQALQVLESAGFAATGTFNRDEATAAITAQHSLFAVVAGGSVDREAEAELRAAAEARGGQVVRASIGDSDPTRHFIDNVLPQLEKLRSTATVEEIRAVAPTAGYARPLADQGRERR